MDSLTHSLTHLLEEQQQQQQQQQQPAHCGLGNKLQPVLETTAQTKLSISMEPEESEPWPSIHLSKDYQGRV
jgi:hypothetical protein